MNQNRKILANLTVENDPEAVLRGGKTTTGGLIKSGDEL